MYTKRLILSLMVGTLLWLSGCSSLEITAADNDKTTTSSSGLAIDAEVSFSPNNPEPNTSITVTVPTVGRILFEVMNITGHRVALLADEENVQSGYLSVQWDATNDAGEKLKTGIYFYRVEAEQEVLWKAVVLCLTQEECEDLLDVI